MTPANTEGEPEGIGPLWPAPSEAAKPMSDVGCVQGQKLASVLQAKPAPQHDPHAKPRKIDANAGDRVELSDAAARIGAQPGPPAVSEQRITDIQARIAAGTYLTPDKLDAAIAGLWQDIVGGE